MANPRITFRCPTDLYSQLPDDERERSRLIIDLLRKHYDATAPEAQIAQLERKVEALQVLFHQRFG